MQLNQMFASFPRGTEHCEDQMRHREAEWGKLLLSKGETRSTSGWPPFSPDGARGYGVTKYVSAMAELLLLS